MLRDRKEVSKIFDPIAYDQLEQYIEQERIQAISAAFTACFIMLDQNQDPRTEEFPSMIEEVLRNLE